MIYTADTTNLDTLFSTYHVHDMLYLNNFIN